MPTQAAAAPAASTAATPVGARDPARSGNGGINRIEHDLQQRERPDRARVPSRFGSLRNNEIRTCFGGSHSRAPRTYLCCHMDAGPMSLLNIGPDGAERDR